MNFLFDDASPSASPPDTEAWRLGAQRIRELKDLLQTYISKFLDNAGAFKTNVVPGTILTNASVGLAQMGAGSVNTPQLVDGALTADATGRAKMADGFTTAIKLEELARGDVHQFAVGNFAGSNPTAYTMTLSPVPTAYTTGMVVKFQALGGNVGGVTLNVNGLGAKTVNRIVNGFGVIPCVTGDIQINQVVTVVYDGANFQLVSSLRATFTTGGLFTLPGPGTFYIVAHGLGGVPRWVRWVLVCQTADLGYSVGDEVDVDSAQINGNANQMFSWGANATNIFISEAPGNFTLVRLDTQVRTLLSNVSFWALKCYASL